MDGRTASVTLFARGKGIPVTGVNLPELKSGKITGFSFFLKSATP
jgi:hypothetical protein